MPLSRPPALSQLVAGTLGALPEDREIHAVTMHGPVPGIHGPVARTVLPGTRLPQSPTSTRPTSPPSPTLLTPTKAATTHSAQAQTRSPPVKRTFIHFDSPVRTMSVVTPPRSVPSSFAPIVPTQRFIDRLRSPKLYERTPMFDTICTPIMEHCGYGLSATPSTCGVGAGDHFSQVVAPATTTTQYRCPPLPPPMPEPSTAQPAVLVRGGMHATAAAPGTLLRLSEYLPCPDPMMQVLQLPEVMKPMSIGACNAFDNTQTVVSAAAAAAAAVHYQDPTAAAVAAAAAAAVATANSAANNGMVMYENAGTQNYYHQDRIATAGVTSVNPAANNCMVMYENVGTQSYYQQDVSSILCGSNGPTPATTQSYHQRVPISVGHFPEPGSASFCAAMPTPQVMPATQVAPTLLAAPSPLFRAISPTKPKAVVTALQSSPRRLSLSAATAMRTPPSACKQSSPVEDDDEDDMPDEPQEEPAPSIEPPKSRRSGTKSRRRRGGGHRSGNTVVSNN